MNVERGSGYFITFEGPEGAGKSTQIQLLASWLGSQGYEVVVTREPGGTAIGDAIRDVLFLRPATPALDPLTEAFLMNASRAQLVREVLQPALAQGKVVLCDRYADATLAYQGAGGGVDVDALRQLIFIATSGLTPDLTIYLDITPEIGLERKFGAQQSFIESAASVAHRNAQNVPDQGAEAQLNYIDRLEIEFHRRVVAGYRRLIDENPERWLVVPAEGSPNQVEQELRVQVAQRLQRHREFS